MWYIIIGIVAVFLGFGSLHWRNVRRKVALGRANVTLASFIDEFTGIDCNARAIRAAYGDVTKLCGHGVFRKDELERTLGIDPEDFQDVFDKRCKQLGVADVWKSPYAKLFPLKTVEDYVRFLSEVMKDHPVAS